MKIAVLSEGAKISFARGLVANELGGRMSLVYKFSDADGVRTGKSGWSFGISQFDINNNGLALICLRDCGFTTDEVAALRAQDPSVNMDQMNAKLLSSRDTVDRYDRKQISECLSWPLALCNEIGVEFDKECTYLHVADYHNQFGMSRGGKMCQWLKSRGSSPLTPEEVRDFKYTLPYGIKQRVKDRDHDDVWRRYENIVRICNAA